MPSARDEPLTASAEAAGREEVLRSIAAQARQETAALLAEADTQAAALMDAARRSVADRVAAGVDAAEEEARTEAAREVNEARRRLVHRRAELASRRFDEVFDAAAHRLDEIASGGDRERWARAMGVLVREGCQRAGPGATIEVRSCDVGLVEPALAPPASVVGTLRDAGVRVRSADGRGEVDGRLGTRLERARSAVACQVAATLGLGSGEVARTAEALSVAGMPGAAEAPRPIPTGSGAVAARGRAPALEA